MTTAVKELINSSQGVPVLPPLSEGARELLALDASKQMDSRVLSLIAQKDPVQVTKLLILANSAAFGRHTLAVSTVPEAIRVIGAKNAYSTMTAIAMANSFASLKVSGAIKSFILSQALSASLTARKVASRLDLDEQSVSTLVMGSLFLPLGLYLALMSNMPLANKVANALTAVIASSSRDLRGHEDLEGYNQLGQELAKSWDAPHAVIDALRDSKSVNGLLLQAIEAVMTASATKNSQLECLVEIFANNLDLSKKLPSNEVYLAVIIG